MSKVGTGQFLLHCIALGAYGLCGGWGLYRTVKKKLDQASDLLVVMVLGIVSNLLLLGWLFWERGVANAPTDLEIVLVVSAGIGLASIFLSGYSRSPFSLVLSAFVMTVLMSIETVRLFGTSPEVVQEPIRSQLGFYIHIGPILFSYIAFTVSFICGLLFLFQNRQLRAKKQGFFVKVLPSLELVNDWNRRSLLAGFFLLTIGIFAGIFGGRYMLEDPPSVPWYYDPRALFTIVAWMGYGVLLTVRKFNNFKGRLFALYSVVCYLLLFVMAFGTKLFWDGLYHAS